MIDDFGLEWKRKDGKVYKADYDVLIKAYEGQKEHEQEIRNKAIDTFMIAIETLVKFHDVVALSEIQEIAEQMKALA